MTTKIISAIKASTGGLTIPEVDTYADLSIVASDGDLARVTTTEAYGLYVYKATVGGDAFGMWLPDQYGSRINDYIRDGSGNPCKISTSSGLGSDTVSAITSRGWTENSAEATNIEITDIGGDIDLDSTTGHGSLWPTLRFTHDTLFADGTYLLVMEMDAITTPGTGSHAGSWVIVADGVTSARLSFSYANVADDISWVNTWNVDAGEGYFTQTAYTRVFALLPVEATTTGSALYSLWDSANGQTNTDTLVTATKPEFKSVAAKNVEFQVAPQSGHNSRVRELHLFKLD